MKSRVKIKRLVRTARRLQLVPLRLGSLLFGGAESGRVAPRVLAHVPTFLPEQRAGSEISMAATLQGLRERGWEVTVIVDSPGTNATIEDLDVVRQPSLRSTLRLYRSADVVLTQLASRNRATRWSALTGQPLVLFLRMGGLDTASLLGDPDLVVFNSSWLQRASEWTGPSVVQHPPIEPERYRTTPGESITLVNLTEQKGSNTLVALARRFPEKSFLGVRGGWGEQLRQSDLENLRIIGPVDDMREVYSQTRVLLMPSAIESFGRVGIEAAASGIPVIASPIPGIREALGNAALYADRTNVDAWEHHLRSLDDPVYWADCSRRSLEQSERWHRTDEIQELADQVNILATRDSSRGTTIDDPPVRSPEA